MLPLFLFPTTNEMSSISSKSKSQILYKEKDFWYMTCGMGEEAQKIVSLCQEENIIPIVIGYGGALVPELVTGDVVVSNTFMHQDEKIEVPEKLVKQYFDILKNNNINVHLKSCYTSSGVISTTKEKELVAKKGAWVVDMEGYFLATRFTAMNIPFLSIRIILDTYTTKLPDLTDTLERNGQISLVKTILHLLKYPCHIRDFIKIFFLTQKAKPIIRKCCYSIVNFRKNI